jgi:predicted dithiol-disulfide oxidoreductase (DUF899 family)
MYDSAVTMLISQSDPKAAQIGQGCAWACRVLEDQLAATQADLEAATAELERTGNSLQHALRSKKSLMAWKLRAQPEVVSLQQQLAVLQKRAVQLEVCLWLLSVRSCLPHV